MSDHNRRIDPAQQRLIEALARRDVARYLRAQAAPGNAGGAERPNHADLPASRRAA